MLIAVIGVLLFSGSSVLASPAPATLNLTQYVNPFIGTDLSGPPAPDSGGTLPGAVLPFGMVQFSPDTPNALPSGYRYSDTVIEEFSLTHMSGAGCQNSEDIGILPIVGSFGRSPGTHWTTYASTHSKSNESASPGYYKTRLERYNTTVELTATTRTGMARFSFPATQQATVLVNTSRSATGNREGSINISGNRITGNVTGGGFCASTKTFKIYFAIEFDRQPTSYGTWFAFSLTPGSTSSGGRDSGGYVTFDTTLNPVVQMKIGISFVSVASAQQNLVTENPGWDFNAIRANANVAWNNILNRVQVSGGTPTDLQKFYTALYHVFLAPNIASDVNGQYVGFDYAVHTANGMTVYQNFSGWDIYRSWAALMAMIAPNEMTDIIKSMILDGQQGGALPKWSQQNQEHFIMNGDPGPIIVASAYAFGLRDFDTQTALTLMNKSANIVGATSQGIPIRGNLATYLSLRYVPGYASDSLEYAAADFAIAQFAKALGNADKYTYFMNRAQWWVNVFDPQTGYIRPRNSDGTFFSPFDPKSNVGFAEGNAAQYTFMVPHNYATLFNLLGGKQRSLQRLDDLFTQIRGGFSQPYFHIANEIGHNQPWAYHFAGAPWGTQAVVRRIINEAFTAEPGGLPGNDDLGATSAWYVWANLGMFPVTPGTDTLALHGPFFNSITLQSAHGNVQITGVGAGNTSPYIQSLSVNGTPTTRTWLRFSEIANGTTLNFVMGNSPNKNWGVNPEDAPPSFTDGMDTSTPPPTSNCDGGEGVYLYESANYQGRCSKFTNDVSDLTGWYVGDNATSSIRLVGNWTATLYEQVNYQGTGSTFRSDDPDLGNDAIGNDRASSIRVERTVIKTCATIPVGQFCGEYYNTRDLSGNVVLMRNEDAINFDWGNGSPGTGVNSDNFSAIWRGRFNFEAGNYIFSATTDDGIRVYVDGVRIIDSWRTQSPTEYRQTRAISAGEHEIKVEYFENGGGAVVRVRWEK